MAYVISVNVGVPKAISWMDQQTTTAIWKIPVGGRVAVRGVNVAGDAQGDRRVHGGPDKAVYAYAREDEQWWEDVLGQALAPGTFGENLTVEGVDVTGALVGERWEIGSVILEVCQPRMPCWKLGARMNDPMFPKRFSAAGRPGAYLRIVREGELGAGDAVNLIHRPAHDITVGLAASVRLQDGEQAERLLNAPELPKSWHKWARGAVASREGKHRVERA